MSLRLNSLFPQIVPSKPKQQREQTQVCSTGLAPQVLLDLGFLHTPLSLSHSIGQIEEGWAPARGL